MRASRLVSIVLWLQNQGKMSARQLAEQLEVSERTILRDMEELSASGVPVYAERGKEGGWQLSEGYRTSLTGMHSDELAALLVSSRPELLSDLGQEKQLEAALQKLLAATTDSARNSADAVRRKLHIDGAGWHANRQPKERTPCLAAVQETVWEEKALRITYERDGAEKTRVVHPLGLVAKRSVWYLVAKTEDDGLRTFRVSRLLRAEPLPETFIPPRDFDLAAYWDSSLEQFRDRLPKYPAKLRLRSDTLARLASERFATVLGSTKEEGGEGWLHADVAFETLESACEIILGLGARAEALEPPDLRRRVKDEIETARMLYL
ncbi:YafY family protein [Paenibacillus sp. LHD-117]|uniref:helix-turn-helix transcriptional regulator n=1 Tax=Paenibacillus sp. LHD-117 TaxID=3071412 RepID=UPI0027E12B2C|nr:YafY family protein [Paenibacillus sp. LHD-117]MDQ6420036.1 YafY family protein [Paenibacillus sp. LHD-117]